jgi:uncharacterized surface protein with fasciclin (FAS1) repeats
MRKFGVLLLVGLLMLGVIPVFAQDAPGTIADIVVASAGAETPEFATLLAAVQAADPAVLEALSNPDASLTVFAPTDAAFAALGEETISAVLADQPLLTSILLFHVLDGAVMSADVVAGLEASNNLLQVPSLQGQYIDISADDMGAVQVNGANLNLEMVDIAASNGVIHVIDAVILPETRNIAEIVTEMAGMEMPEFSTLLAAVGAADPAVLETLANPEAELTVFAPTDAAFAALGEETISAVLADQPMLTSILLYHVAPAIVYSNDLAAELAPMEGDMEATPEAEMMPAWLVSKGEGTLEVATAQGGTATISLREDGVYINDAKIVTTNVDAANGVIHVIDAVILPPA